MSATAVPAAGAGKVELQCVLVRHAQSGGVDHQRVVRDGGVPMFPGHQGWTGQIAD